MLTVKTVFLTRAVSAVGFRNGATSKRGCDEFALTNRTDRDSVRPACNHAKAQATKKDLVGWGYTDERLATPPATGSLRVLVCSGHAATGHRMFDLEGSVNRRF